MGQQFSAGQREREVRIERDKKKKSTTVKAGRTEHPPPAVLFLIIQRVHSDNDQTRQMTGDNHPKRFGSFGLQLQL